MIDKQGAKGDMLSGSSSGWMYPNEVSRRAFSSRLSLPFDPGVPEDRCKARGFLAAVLKVSLSLLSDTLDSTR